MMLFTDKALRDAGLDFAMARALLAPAEDEVTVHIHQCLDGPPVPHGTLDHVTPQGPDARYSSLGIQGGATDSLSVYTLVPSDTGLSDDTAPRVPDSGGSGTRPPLMRDLGADTLGAIERDAQVLAATYGAELHPASHGEYTLVSRTGTTTHASLHAALKSLKPPVEYLLDRLDAATVKAEPVDCGISAVAAPLVGVFGARLDVEIPVLPEGCSLNAIRYVAHLLGVQVQASKTGSVLLTGAFGSKVFTSHARAASALNKRAWT